MFLKHSNTCWQVIPPFDVLSLDGFVGLLLAGCFLGSSDTLFPAAAAAVAGATGAGAAAGAADFFFFPPIKSPKHLSVYESVMWLGRDNSSIRCENVVMTHRKQNKR